MCVVVCVMCVLFCFVVWCGVCVAVLCCNVCCVAVVCVLFSGVCGVGVGEGWMELLCVCHGIYLVLYCIILYSVSSDGAFDAMLHY